MMESNNLLLYSILLVVTLLVAVVGLLVVYLILDRKKENTSSRSNYSEKGQVEDYQEKVKQLKEDSLKKVAPRKIQVCENHPEQNAKGVCNICNQSFCSDCISEEQGLNFCKEHFHLYLSNKWEEFINIKSNPERPEEGIFLFEFKNHIYKSKNIPTIIITQYKINLENDQIESYVSLQCLPGDKLKISTNLKNHDLIPGSISKLIEQEQSQKSTLQ